MKLRIEGQLFNLFNHPNFALPSVLNAGIPGKPATQTGFGAIAGITYPPSGLRRQYTQDGRVPSATGILILDGPQPKSPARFPARSR